VVHQKNKQGKPKKHISKPKVDSAPKTYGGGLLQIKTEMGWITDAQSSGMVNPDFIYPGSTYTIAAKADAAKSGLQKVERGYIRKLNEAVYMGNSLGKSYCKFQFNPDVIQRGVQARNDIQYWFNQDAAQMTQPIPGDASFGFVLLFNREAEVNSGKYVGGHGGTLKPGSTWPPPNDVPAADRMVNTRDKIENEVDRWAAVAVAHANMTAVSRGAFNPAWVTDLGVLIDLMVLDDITGQSISQASVDAIMARNKASLVLSNAKEKAEAEAAEKKRIEAGGEKSKEDKEDSAKEKEIITDVSLNANIGNTAFLIAQPVRVIFTKWFMVEGYISSINVTFNKFSASMIPTQCVVDIQMQALYMGFAKKDTYLTTIAEQVNKDLASGITGSAADTGVITAATPAGVLPPDINVELLENRGFLQAGQVWSKGATYKYAEVESMATTPGKGFGDAIFTKKDPFPFQLRLYLNEIDTLLKGHLDKYGKEISGTLDISLHWNEFVTDGTVRSVGNGSRGLTTYTSGTVTVGTPGILISGGIESDMSVWGTSKKPINREGESAVGKLNPNASGDNDRIELTWMITPTDFYKDESTLRPFSNEKFTMTGLASINMPYITAAGKVPINLGYCFFSGTFEIGKGFKLVNQTWTPGTFVGRKPGGGPQ